MPAITAVAGGSRGPIKGARFIKHTNQGAPARALLKKMAQPLTLADTASSNRDERRAYDSAVRRGLINPQIKTKATQKPKPTPIPSRFIPYQRHNVGEQLDLDHLVRRGKNRCSAIDSLHIQRTEVCAPTETT